jgi:nitrite reductase (NADH) large subunit
VKATELLCKVATAAEVLEYCAAIIQLYREQGRYLERVHKWTKRVGLDTVRQQIVEDAAKRQALFERFLYAQKFAQTDPWAEHATAAFASEYQPLAVTDFAAVA